MAQERWNLKRAVDYALANNISVKQQDVQARITELQLKQSKLSQYPSANTSANIGYSSGRNQNPVSFDLITQGYLFSNFSLQAGIDLFNWYSKKKHFQVVMRQCYQGEYFLYQAFQFQTITRHQNLNKLLIKVMIVPHFPVL